MTEIMLRHCPGCKKTLVKVGGCNQMECPHCKTCSCYVCRKKIGPLVLCLRCPTYSSAEEDDIRNRDQLLEEMKKEAAHRHDKDLIASLSKLGFKEKGRTVRPCIHPLLSLQDYDDVTIFMAVIFCRFSLMIISYLLRSVSMCFRKFNAY